MATTILKNIKQSRKGTPSQHLKNSINYIMNPKKTENGLWVYSNSGVTSGEIYNSMLQTKEDFNKKWGRQGYHFVISFKPGETDERTCFNVGKEFCEKYLGNGYEYVLAVHNDHEHMHCHIVFNSVGRLDGRKYRYINGDWEKHIQPVTDEITTKYGLSRLEYDKSGERAGKSYAEHAAEKADKFTWKKIIRLDIDMAVSNSSSIEEYFEEMKRMGYQMRIGHSEKHGEYVSYHHPAMKVVEGRTSKAARRDYNLGEGYTLGEIKRRVREKNKRIVYPDTVYVKKGLHTISEHRASRFQVCAVMRYRQAAQYHYFDMQLKEQIRVRKDLLDIDRLRDECNYIIDNNITDIQAVKDKLDAVKKDIKMLKEQSDDNSFSNSLYDEEELKVRDRYVFVYNTLITADADMSDDEYERLSDELEELETKYPDITAHALVHSNNKGCEEKLAALYEEKRILSGIIKEADVTESVTKLPEVRQRASEKDRNKGALGSPDNVVKGV